MFNVGDKVRFNARAREVFGTLARPGIFTVGKSIPPNIIEIEETGQQWYDVYFDHEDAPESHVLPSGPYFHKRHNQVVLLDKQGVYAVVAGPVGRILTMVLPESEHHLMIPIPVPTAGE